MYFWVLQRECSIRQIRLCEQLIDKLIREILAFIQCDLFEFPFFSFKGTDLQINPRLMFWPDSLDFVRALLHGRVVVSKDDDLFIPSEMNLWT